MTGNRTGETFFVQFGAWATKSYQDSCTASRDFNHCMYSAVLCGFVAEVTALLSNIDTVSSSYKYQFNFLIAVVKLKGIISEELKTCWGYPNVDTSLVNLGMKIPVLVQMKIQTFHKL